MMKENEKIMELATEIVEILKENGNPHIKVEISMESIEQTSVDWSQPTDEWN